MQRARCMCTSAVYLHFASSHRQCMLTHRRCMCTLAVEPLAPVPKIGVEERLGGQAVSGGGSGGLDRIVAHRAKIDLL